MSCDSRNLARLERCKNVSSKRAYLVERANNRGCAINTILHEPNN